MQENLLTRCQVCHPDATSNFPTAWMSHYIPSPSHFPAVYYVNLFYTLFIPAVLGFMVVMVGLDVGHSVYVKSRRKGHSDKVPPESQVIEGKTPVTGPENHTEQGDQPSEEVTHG